MTDVVHVIVGPPRHGVVRWAHAIAGALGAPVVAADHPDDLAPNAVSRADAVHIHFTDRLFGPNATEGAAAFVALTRRLPPVGVTLHDVPQPSDGAAADRRVRAYRDVVRAVRGVVVSSEHERMLLAESDVATDVQVIPLAVTAPAQRRPSMTTQPDVAILGWLYPGKGHLEVLAAMTVLDERFGLTAIGAVSPGHDDLAVDLRRAADRAGRRLTITGFVPDAGLESVLRSAAVPVAHHRNLSASASIPTWIAHGRRPLVCDGRYAAEIDQRSPGTVRRYPDSVAGLGEALASAALDPVSTWIADGVRAHPSWDDVAAAHREVFAGWFSR